MPKMDGYHVLKKIRENSNIPVMILSAKNHDADKILGLDLGADDYLAKPFNPMEAMARINSNIRRFYSLGAKGKELKLSASSSATRTLYAMISSILCAFWHKQNYILRSFAKYQPGRMPKMHPFFHALSLLLDIIPLCKKLLLF